MPSFVVVRDGQVTNRPVFVAIGVSVSVNGERDILGLWAGDGGEGAKFWLSVLTEIKNRGSRSGPGVISLPSRRPLHVFIWPLGHWTRPAKAGHDGPQGESRH